VRQAAIPTLGLALGLLGSPPALAAGATARASATVVEAVKVNAWLGVPVNVQDLLLAANAPAGPGTGALVPRLPGPLPPEAGCPWLPEAQRPPPPEVQCLRPTWIASALDARQAFGIDSVPSPEAALLPRGLAAAVSAAAGDSGGDGGPPLVITVAFN
jgi:hypothetical protein